MHEGPHVPCPGDQQHSVSTDPIVCGRCGCHEVAFRWQVFANGTRHIRVTCRRCCSFVRYGAQTSVNVARADAESGERREVQP